MGTARESFPELVNYNGLALAVGQIVKPVTGATSSAAGKVGMVPAPVKGSTNQVLRSNGKWADIINDKSMEVSIATGDWTQASNKFQVTKNIDGTAPIVSVTVSPSDTNTDDQVFDIFQCGIVATLSNRTVTFTATKKPTQTVKFNLDIVLNKIV